MKLNFILKGIIVLVVACGVGFLAYQVGVMEGEEHILKTPPIQVLNPDIEQPSSVDFAIFWEAWRKLSQSYLKRSNLDYKSMVYGAVSGMVKSLGDPYTTFFTPKEADDFTEELSGQYEGVGMVVDIKEGQIKVVSPFKGSPADSAGLMAGDMIVKIGDQSTTEMTIEEAVSLIKGPEGTKVILFVQREGWTEPKEFAIKREVIKIPTLEIEKIENDQIAVVKMYQFNRILTSEFQEAVFDLTQKPTKGLIIDLRNNPGGYLDEAISMAGWFLKKGVVVTWQDTGEKGQEKPYKTEGPGIFSEYPIVVLLNEGSASGAEILAGALRDQRGIKLVGTRSFGKGSVQEQLPMSDGSSLKVTVATWLTPNMTSINDEGLKPDIEVEQPEGEAKDSQLEKAVEILKSLM